MLISSFISASSVVKVASSAKSIRFPISPFLSRKFSGVTVAVCDLNPKAANRAEEEPVEAVGEETARSEGKALDNSLVVVPRVAVEVPQPQVPFPATAMKEASRKIGRAHV